MKNSIATLIMLSDGRKAAIYKEDQNKTFRCSNPHCRAPINKKHKILIRLMDQDMTELPKRKRIIDTRSTSFRVLGFL